jgi:hypothetical protein
MSVGSYLHFNTLLNEKSEVAELAARLTSASEPTASSRGDLRDKGTDLRKLATEASKEIEKLHPLPIQGCGMPAASTIVWQTPVTDACQ